MGNVGPPPNSQLPKNYSNSCHFLALKILKKYKRPMGNKEITKLIKKEKRFSGKTPANTISSVLHRSACTKKTKDGWILTRDFW